ncbi:hypothetical protein B0H11DRAFT_2277109 [Mycena galericulata]|nr:hypothetical protein B0H11DRAFT_2277109 [Mycena galericulata]
MFCCAPVQHPTPASSPHFTSRTPLSAPTPLSTPNSLKNPAPSSARPRRTGEASLALPSSLSDLALPDHTTPFHKFVRSVTLRTIIVGLLDPTADITYLAAHDIDIVADLINDIWLLSKKLEPISRASARDAQYTPPAADFVIPAWETLWRVVSVTLAQVHMDAEACRSFHDLFDDVSMKQFRAKRLDDTAPSTEDYIIESLRLYPPVKHITRHMFRPRALTRFLPRFLAALIPSRFDIEIA